MLAAAVVEDDGEEEAMVRKVGEADDGFEARTMRWERGRTAKDRKREKVEEEWFIG